MTLPFTYNFRSPYDFLKSNFPISLPRLGYFFFFIEKGNLKFSESKMPCKEESEKTITLVKL